MKNKKTIRIISSIVLLMQGSLLYAQQNARSSWQISPSLEHYSSAARTNGSSSRLDTVGVRVQHPIINENVYVAGQVHTAYSGHAGGYTTGMVGVGIQSTPTSQGLSVGAEVLAGGGRGGDVDRSGVLVQPMVYAGLDVNRDWGVKLGFGRMKSDKGNLNSNLVNLSLTYNLGR
ncbi:MAG: hypothetical protein V4525_04285 [Pseudomonadota bacterium]